MSRFGWNLEARLGLAWGLITLWTALVAASLLWNIHQARQTAIDLARAEAHLSYNKDLSYRLWAAGHGGVYVPVTPQTPPNPYLSHIKERDILTPSGRALTLVNPAYMTRQVHELAARLYGARGHLTSLKPIRPENAPDPWEAKALEAFAAGTNEIIEVVTLAGEPHIRFMRPWLTEKACLKCHGAQGYKEGDIRGGISVDVPLKPYFAVVRAQTLPLAAGHGLIWMLGLAGIILRERHIRRHLEERHQAEEALQQAHDELEQRVKERTFELRHTVEQLLLEIEERQRADRALRESEEKLRALTSQLLTVQEEERSRLSRELHDGLGQTLLVLKLKMRAIEKRLGPDQQTLRQESEQTLRQIDQIIDDVRRLARNLSPSVLEDLGLAVALRNLCEEFSGHQNLNLSLDMDDISGSFSPEAQSHIYRIFQESLTNIGKYSQADQVSLAIKRRDGKMAFVIEDDGVGFQPEDLQARDAAARGMGLVAMAERVRMLGGELQISSKLGAGTRISFLIPEGPQI